MAAVRFEKNNVVIEEIKEFSEKITAFQNRQLDPEAFKHRRLIQGIYGQRQPALFMVRVKIPAGNLDSHMIEGFAQAAEKFCKPVLHITTRQDIQLYNVKIQNLIPLLNLLADFGLTTREASGATMRNIITSPFVGYLRDQAFDIRSIVETTARFFMRHPDTQHLPRKFKLSFSDNEKDYAVSAMHDLGFIAKVQNNKPGFKVVMGGSLGSVPMAARVYNEFVSLEDTLLHTLGILRAFDKHGDRSKRAEARLKFQLGKIGWETFMKYVDEEIQNLKNEKYVFPELKATFHKNEDFNFENPFNEQAQSDLFHWFKHNVLPTPRKNEYMAVVRVPLGDLAVDSARAINKKLSEWHTLTDGDYVTLADSQNLVMKGLVVPENNKAAYFSQIYEFLKQLNLHSPGHRNFGDVISCLGSATCAAGITHSPGLGKELTDKFNNLWLKDERYSGSAIHISGCSNSCARHHLASLGFSGRADTDFSETQHAPAYNVYYGGMYLNDGKMNLAQKTSGKILAKRVPQFIQRVIEYFEEHSDGKESFANYLAKIPAEEINNIVEEFNLKNKPALAEEELEFDWGKNTAYIMEYGEGECS